MERRQDPRSIVTPYAFSVHPDLLGRPLATPWQRLGAILVDLVVIGLLSQIGFVTLAVASTLLLVGLAARRPGRDALGKLFRVAAGCLGALVLAVTILVVVLVRYERAHPDGSGVEAVLEEALRDLVPPEGSLPGPAVGGEDTASDTVAPGPAVAQEVRARDSLAPAPAPAREDTLPSSGIPPEAPEVTEVRDPAEGLPPAALDTIGKLNVLLESLRNERDDSRTALLRAQRELAEAEDRSPLQWLWDLVEDLGLGFGWGALYLTLTHTWWKGTSVGKRLFKIRVVLIDKRPLSLWLSFERAGGYAAGFATGLLGFAQIFWDPNRQAIHDKVSETIVIQDGKDPVPGPWIREGQAEWLRARSGAGEPGGP